MKKFLPKTIKNPQGFTLIELMVVITIIAFLAVIGIASFTNAQKTARDGRRRADIEAIAQAYESNYNAVTGTYLVLAGSQFNNNTIPLDPSTNAAYAGNTVNGAKGFWACATLDITTNGNASAVGGGTGTSTYPVFVAANTGSLYCRASQQSQ